MRSETFDTTSNYLRVSREPDAPLTVGFWSARPDVAAEIADAAADAGVALRPLGRGVRRPTADIWILDIDWVASAPDWGRDLIADPKSTIILYGEPKTDAMTLRVTRPFIARCGDLSQLSAAIAATVRSATAETD